MEFIVLNIGLVSWSSDFPRTSVQCAELSALQKSMNRSGAKKSVDYHSHNGRSELSSTVSGLCRQARKPAALGTPIVGS